MYIFKYNIFIYSDIDNQYITEECFKKTLSYNTIKKM